MVKKTASQSRLGSDLYREGRGQGENMAGPARKLYPHIIKIIIIIITIIF